MHNFFVEGQTQTHNLLLDRPQQVLKNTKAEEVTLVWQLVEANSKAYKTCHFDGLEKSKKSYHYSLLLFHGKHRLKAEQLQNSHEKWSTLIVLEPSPLHLQCLLGQDSGWSKVLLMF